jgi:hypothetical protein
MDETGMIELSEIAIAVAQQAVSEAKGAGYTNTAEDDDVTELARDIETWLRAYMQSDSQEE